MDRKYPRVIGSLLDHLGLPRTSAGCQRAHRALKVSKAMGIRIKEGEFEGCLDSGRIESEVLPSVLKRRPELNAFLVEFGEGFATLCSWLDSFMEGLHLLSGNRPLPMHHGVHVKDLGEALRFGFLVWAEGAYIVKLKESDGALRYETAFDCAMDGWSVD